MKCLLILKTREFIGIDANSSFPGDQLCIQTPRLQPYGLLCYLQECEDGQRGHMAESLEFAIFNTWLIARDAIYSNNEHFASLVNDA